MNVPLWFALPVAFTTLVAAGVDVRTRRIPNALTFTAMLAGVAAHAAVSRGAGLTDSLLGLAVAGAMLLPGWLAGWMGAGDVKLMAAVGAWLGFPQGVFATLAALMAGGAIALVLAARHGALKRSIWGAATIGSWVATRGLRSAPPPVTTGIRFPFAVAVCAGSLAAVWIHL